MSGIHSWVPDNKFMKYLLLTVLLLFSSNQVLASEYLGTISTNLLDPQGWEIQAAEAYPAPVATNGLGLVNKRVAISPDKEIVNPSDLDKGTVVKGIEIYPDGSLIRGKSRTIYVIRDNYKKRIFNLFELFDYRGQEIFAVADSVLNEYETKNYWPGDLIREIGAEKIFALLDNGKKHIKSLELLASDYFGQEIFNLDVLEMEDY